jgi:hypothetical protein
MDVEPPGSRSGHRVENKHWHDCCPGSGAPPRLARRLRRPSRFRPGTIRLSAPRRREPAPRGRMPPSPCRGIHGTVKVLHGTVRGLHGTVRGLHETVRVLHETVKRPHETVRVLHETVKRLHETVKGSASTCRRFAPHPGRARRLQGGAASRGGRWRTGRGPRRIDEVGTLLLQCDAFAQAPPPHPARLTYVRSPGAGACPEEWLFRTMVAGHLGGADPFVENAPRRVAVTFQQSFQPRPRAAGGLTRRGSRCLMALEPEGRSP